MTEAEAKTKWCPFSKIATYERRSWNNYTEHAHETKPPGINRETGTQDKTRGEMKIPNGCNCIASQCMAWRVSSYDQDHGYCGLAGQPVAKP